MQLIDTLTMFQMAVSDMPASKDFYVEKLGLKLKSDFRQDDSNWWVSVNDPESGVTITLSTYHGNMKPGTMIIYFKTSDVEAAHKELTDKGMKVNEVKNDLYGPGSGVKWFNMNDPDGNQIFLAAA